jgi:diguanylate cyclase (GGDEF)-like protein
MIYIVQAKLFLHLRLDVSMFLIPVLAGAVFGYLVGKIQVISNLHARLAATDPLTKIFNRQVFTSIMEAETHRASRYERPFSLIMIDIDHFKKVNDTYGHLVGDRVLKKLAQLVQGLNRDSDVFARIGGEEFVIMSTETDLEGARLHAERLRKAIEEHVFDTAGHITCSFGVAQFRRGEDRVETLIKRADDALYRAKKLGRNRVVTEVELEASTEE